MTYGPPRTLDEVVAQLAEEQRNMRAGTGLPSVVTAQTLTAGDHGALHGLGDDDHQQYLLRTDAFEVAPFHRHGTLTVAAGTDRWYNDTGGPLSIETVRGGVGIAPSGAAIKLDVNISGVTAFTTQANRPQIDSGAVTTGPVTNADIVLVESGDYLTVDVDQIGSVTAGSDLTTFVWLRHAIVVPPVQAPVTEDLLLWLAADQITGLADTEPVDVWSDLSGLGNDGSGGGSGTYTAPQFATGETPVGGPAVYFPDAGSTTNRSYVTFGDIMAGRSAGEIFVVLRGPGADCGLYAFGDSSGNSDECHYPFGSTVFDSFGRLTGTRQSYTPGVDIGQWRVLDVWSAPSDWAALIDNVQQASTGTNTVTWNTAPVLGAGMKNNGIDLGFGGWVAEVLVYGRKLSILERDNTYAYLRRHFT